MKGILEEEEGKRSKEEKGKERRIRKESESVGVIINKGKRRGSRSKRTLEEGEGGGLWEGREGFRGSIIKASWIRVLFDDDDDDDDEKGGKEKK